jgi:hypothetical protein
MPAGDVFGLDGIFLNKSNPIVVSTIGINSTAAGAGIAITGGVLNATAGIATLTLSNAAGLSTTPFYVGAKIAVSGITSSTGIAFPGYNGTFVVTGFAGTTTVSYATTGYVGGVTANVGVATTGIVMLVTDTQVTNTTWSSAQTHGWFGGGGGPISTVDRIDFSNDTGTANIRAPFVTARVSGSATGNTNYGWFGGGYAPAVTSRVERINFSNDSAATSIRGPLSSARYRLVATGNSNYGWFGGGAVPGTPIGTVRSTVDRIDFSNDSSTASARGPLSSGRRSAAATGNSNYGWFGGGDNAVFPTVLVSIVNRIDFSNDSPTVSIRGPLSSAKRDVTATGNSNYGWFGGGGPTITSRVDRIDFSNDSPTVSIRGPLSSTRYNAAATGNSNYGWFGGGIAPASPGGTASSIERIDFSNDLLLASVRGPLTSPKQLPVATSGQARSSSIRLLKGGNFGWFGGGSGPIAPTGKSTIDRINFSNDSSTASVRGSLTTGLGRQNLAATGNSNYGWFGGGIIGPPTSTLASTVDRIDFSNDSATTSVRGPLSSARRDLAATGNSNYGWFGGGFTTVVVSTVDRIDFSNDSPTVSIRGPLSQARRNLSATGNSNYGWFGGGQVPAISSRVDRIDFSNDSSTASIRSPLSSTRYNAAATGNSNYGWFGGGFTTVVVSTVDRIDFSNDSATVSIRSPLSVARDRLAATGNSNYGWFGGGKTPTTVATVDRIDFSNDSSTASVRGPLSAGRYILAATSNATR